MATTLKENCNDIIQKVLGELVRVAEHLRQKDQNDAANLMSQHACRMLEAYNNGTVEWKEDAFIMESMTPPQPSPEPVRPHDTPGPRVFAGNSWATIAAIPCPEGNKLVKYRPSDAIKCTVSDQVTPPPTENGEEMRVVWILGWDKDTMLEEASDRIQNRGPLLSMVYDPFNNAVCIIFQHGSDAAIFLNDSANCVARQGVSLFGPGHNVIQGDAYPKDPQLVLMEPPVNERRRLTFARSQLFTGVMSEHQFKRDLATIVGQHNIIRVWLFNSGNATVIFTGTVVARTIRDEFRRRARQNGPYKDVSVSFSHDPCERTINYVTQIPQNGGSYHSTSPANGAQRNSPPGGRSRSNGTGVPRSVASNVGDGWTTVKRGR